MAGLVDAVLEQAVAQHEIPGIVALSATASDVIYAGAFGERTLGTGIPMTLDTVFWIASMTKAVTTVAALQLVEQGSLELDSPLEGVLPELASILVLEGFDATGTPVLRKPKQPITLRHLLTHTAGFGYDVWNADLLRYTAYAQLAGVGVRTNQTFAMPLVSDPGERWEYGVNTDWVGKAVEAASGKSLEAYMRAHIFEPLGMRDSGFVVGADQRTRLAGRHQRNADGSLSVIPFEVPREPEFFMGGGGLYSTGPDYLRFLRALLAHGSGILQPETVAEMRRNQIGDLEAGVLRSVVPATSNDHDPFPGMPIRWSLGFMITTLAGPSGRSPGSLAWAGLANTYYWLDPVRNITGVIMTQILPFVDPAVMATCAKFERAVYATLA